VIIEHGMLTDRLQEIYLFYTYKKNAPVYQFFFHKIFSYVSPFTRRAMRDTQRFSTPAKQLLDLEQ